MVGAKRRGGAYVEPGSGDQSSRSRQRMRDASGSDIDRPSGNLPSDGAPRRGGRRQDRTAAIRRRAGLRIPLYRRVGRRVGYGTGLRRPPATVCTDPRTPRRTSRTPARSAECGIRTHWRIDSRSIPGRVGRAEPDGRRRCRSTVALRGRRRAMARPGVGADTCLRGPTAPGRARRIGLRSTRQRRRGVGGASGNTRRRALRRRRPRPPGIGDVRRNRSAGAGPHRRRDARRTPGDLGGSAKHHRDRVGRWVLDIREALVDGGNRATVRPPHQVASRAGPETAADRRRRTGRRCRAVPAAPQQSWAFPSMHWLRPKLRD